MDISMDATDGTASVTDVPHQDLIDKEMVDNQTAAVGHTSVGVDQETLKLTSGVEMEENKTEGLNDLQQPNERRSDRLKKTTTLTTMEKNQQMAHKRNLEGNPPNPNSFSVLPIEELVDVASYMGIALDESDFATFNLLKELETARHDLFAKQNEMKVVTLINSEVEPDNNDNILCLEWTHDDMSDLDDFTLVESRKKKREKRKSILISPNGEMGRQVQEISDLPKKEVENPRGLYLEGRNIVKK